MRTPTVLLFLIIITTFSTIQIYAHTFSTNESVIFLALVDKLKTQAQLIEQFLLENDYDSAINHVQLLKQLYNNDTNKEVQEENKRVANEISLSIKKFSMIDPKNITKAQLDKIVLDFESILDEAITVRIADDILNNSTTQALRLSTLVNDVDINYANSFNVLPYNISSLSIGNTSSNHQPPQFMNLSAVNMDRHDQNHANISKEIQNDTTYSTALGLSYTLSDLFKEIQSKQTMNEPDKINQLNEGIAKLISTIELKKPYTEVVKGIHGLIQPSLQELYNLKLDIE